MYAFGAKIVVRAVVRESEGGSDEGSVVHDAFVLDAIDVLFAILDGVVRLDRLTVLGLRLMLSTCTV